MALSDDLKDYIAQNSDAKTAIPDQHSVFIVGETHAPTEDMTGKSAVRTNSSTRLVQELLFDPKFRYYGSEYLDNAGCLNIGTGRLFCRYHSGAGIIILHGNGIDCGSGNCAPEDRGHDLGDPAV